MSEERYLPGSGRQRLAVDLDRDRLELLSVQDEGAPGGPGGGRLHPAG